METLLYLLCTSLPCHIIVLYQYWHFPWRSRKLAVALACVNMTVKLWVAGQFLCMGLNLRMLEFFFSTLGALIYFVMVKVDPFKLLFTYVLILDYLIVVRGVASFLTIRILSAGAQSWRGSALCALLYLVTMPFALHYFRRAAYQAEQANNPTLWRTIWLVPAITSTVVLLYTDAFQADTAGSWIFLMARLSLLLCVIVACFMLLQALNSFQRQTALEEQARQSEYILALQRSQYANLQTYMEEVRRARHNLRQHHNVIQSFLDSGDTEQLRAYLKAQDTIPADAIRNHCRNYAVNMLLNHYAGQMVEAGVDFSFQIDLPETLTVSEPDLCVVLGNLLENALEACAGQEEPYIRVAARGTGSRAITLIVDNTAPRPPEAEAEGTFRSTKHPGGGIGTQSVRYIARQYNGTADFHWEAGVFYTSVFLNPDPA